jgi:hypothetical protein
VLAAELAFLSSLLDAGLSDDPQLRALCDDAVEAIGWFVTPAGRLAPFGDTEAGAPAPIGDAASSGLRTFPESGFAVVRVPRGRRPERASYLAQICSFHSTRHKHADELAVVWHDEGVALLADPGRYGLVGRNAPGSEAAKRGFRYSDPKRSFVESTAAHSTVEIDGRSDARVRSRAYGSALRRTVQERDAWAIETSVRRERVTHTRVVAFRPHSWLVIVDVLAGPGGPHEFAQRFHRGPVLVLVATGDRASAALGGEPRLDVLPLIGADSFSAVRGQETPRLLGWVSPSPLRLEPAWSVAAEAQATSRHVFATAFVLSQSGAETAPGLARANASGRRVRLGWVADGRRQQVDIATDGEQLSLRHRAPVIDA